MLHQIQEPTMVTVADQMIVHIFSLDPVISQCFANFRQHRKWWAKECIITHIKFTVFVVGAGNLMDADSWNCSSKTNPMLRIWFSEIVTRLPQPKTLVGTELWLVNPYGVRALAALVLFLIIDPSLEVIQSREFEILLLPFLEGRHRIRTLTS